MNYDIKNWQLLTHTLNSDNFINIDVMNRALLIVDAMDLANCGVLNYDMALILVQYVSREKLFVPWNAAVAKLEPVNAKLCRTPIYGLFKVRH